MVFNDTYNAFEYLYNVLKNSPVISNGTKAIFNINFTILDISKRGKFPKFRRFKESYALREFEWYISGDRNIRDISKYAKLWKQMADKDGNVWSNYGWHWKQNNQLLKIINLLRKDINTRRAVILHYDYHKLDDYNKDTPCNLVLHFQYFNNKLNLTVFARSIDLIYGFSNDQYVFSMLLEQIADELNVTFGTLSYMISNLHIYPKHFNL